MLSTILMCVCAGMLVVIGFRVIQWGRNLKEIGARLARIELVVMRIDEILADQDSSQKRADSPQPQVINFTQSAEVWLPEEKDFIAMEDEVDLRRGRT